MRLKGRMGFFFAKMPVLSKKSVILHPICRMQVKGCPIVRAEIIPSYLIRVMPA